jgi:predicted porin
MQRVSGSWLGALCLFGTISVGPVFAQSGPNIVMYGIADASLEYSNDDANAQLSGSPAVLQPGQSGVRVTSGVNSGSRLGFRGSEAIAPGLRALFQIEHQFQIDTGDGTASQFWNRQAYVGLDTAWGRVTLGRQYSPVYTLLQTYDVTAYRLYNSWDKFVSVSRWDNALEYRAPKLAGLDITLMAGLGENLVPTETSKPPFDTSGMRSGNRYGAGARWSQGAWSVGAAYQSYAIRSLSPGYDVDGAYEWSVALGYRVSQSIQLAAGYLVNNNNLKLLAAPNVERRQIAHYLLSAAWAVGGGRFMLNYVRIDPQQAVAQDRFGLSYEWSLSNRTSLYASLGLDSDFSYNANATGSAATATLADRAFFALGVRHLF